MTPEITPNSGHEPGRVPLDDVLDAYLLSAKNPSRAALAEWIRRFPYYERELTEFAAAWALMDALPPLAPDVEEASSRGRPPRLSSAVRDLLREKRGRWHQEHEEEYEAAPPIKDMVLEAKQRGMSLPQLADLAGMSVALLRKLDLRLISFKTIPGEAVEAVAQALGRDALDIAEYLRRPPARPMAAWYRADAAPTFGKREDFFSAVRADTSLSDARRRRWLALESRDR